MKSTIWIGVASALITGVAIGVQAAFSNRGGQAIGALRTTVISNLASGGFAFLVAAVLRDGAVSSVRIASEKGRACTVQNPWPGRTVQIVRQERAAELVSTDRFTFRTAEGETIELKPQL